MAGLFNVAVAQRPGSREPRQEKLLNGLRLLMWNDPSAADVKVGIRIHSGSAFDPQGKEGVMQLLADNIFPTPASRDYFSEELGGGIQVVTNYDYIQVNASARSADFVKLLESLAQAISQPTIDKETTDSLKRTLAEKLASLEKDPVYLAERAAAKRLFGTFPYGRPAAGTRESLERIDHADLLFVKERFLTADNATVAISGNFNSDFGYRAARRFFGGWLKSDKRIPATFKQPDDPDTKTLELNADGAIVRSSFAFRGIARNDPDYAASRVLERILKGRLQKQASGFSVASEARMLPGVVSVSGAGTAVWPPKILTDRIGEAEFNTARAEALAEFSNRSPVDQWLDADTYGIKVATETQAFQKITLPDVQRLADRLARNPVVSVVVRPAANTAH